MNLFSLFIFSLSSKEKLFFGASQCEVSDRVANFSAISNLDDTQNVSCLGLSDRNICPKSYA